MVSTATHPTCRRRPRDALDQADVRAVQGNLGEPRLLWLQHPRRERALVQAGLADHRAQLRRSDPKDAVLAVLGFFPAPAYAEKSAIQNRISHLYNEHVAPQSRTYQEGEVSQEKMRARTRLLQALHSKDPEAIRQAKADAIKAGYSAEAVGKIGTVPSDVFLFSKLPEADQQAILRQANKDEFERYIGHAHMKLRVPMRQERAGKQAEAPAPASPPSSAPPATVAPAPRPATPPPSPRPGPLPPPAEAWPPPPTFKDLRLR